jgi:dTMP kinase
MKLGRFITLEGSEGAGKSTMAKIVRKWLEANKKRVVVTREPGGTPVAEELRKLLLDTRNRGLCDTAELLMMFASRAQHVNELILPSLKSGHDVVCDRFSDASYAYQGGGRKMGFEVIEALEEIVHPNLVPDLTLLYDLPAQVGLERAGKRGSPDRFENEHMAFFYRVRKAYLKRAKAQPKRFFIVNANQALSRVKADTIAALEERLGS